MKSNNSMLLGLAIALMAASAQAEIYICQDASGRTITSDRQIMECADRKVRILGKNGVTKREISAPLTEEQKRQLRIEEDKRKAAIAAAEDQRRQDRALLARYNKEGDIETARKKSLEQNQEHIRREQASLAIAEKRLHDARAEANPYKKGKDIPAHIQRRISDNEQAINDSKQQITERQAEIAKINAKYDETLKRFRELSNPTTAKATVN